MSPGKTRQITYGIGFVWFVTAMVVLGLVIAAIGAARDAWEDRHES